MDLDALAAFLPALQYEAQTMPTIGIDRTYAEHIAALNQLRGGTIARLGWLFVAGSFTTENGVKRRIFEPIVYAPLRVWRQPISGTGYVGRAGDAQLSLMVQDVHARHELEKRFEFGGGALYGYGPEVPMNLLNRMPRLQSFARDAARAMGFPGAKLVQATAGPEEFMRRDDVVVVVGAGLFLRAEDKEDLTRAGSLRRWASENLGHSTAFHSLYADADSVIDDGGDLVRSPLRLTPSQANAVRASRTANVSVLQGAPGTGKSHTIAAIALDQIQRGGSVLIVAKSDATVDALIDLLEQCPGPAPVVFGSNERRDALAERLGSGGLSPVSDDKIERAQRLAGRLESQRRATYAHISSLLEIERSIAEGHALAALDLTLADATKRAHDLRHLISEARSTHGLLHRRVARRAADRLRAMLACDAETTDDEAVEIAQDEINAIAGRELMAQGGLTMSELWAQLAKLDQESRDALAAYLSVFYRESARLDEARPAVSALAVALRSGRAARREQLHKLRSSELTGALPLWIGTLADVDDLLPLSPGFFELVILDEAASVEQPLAAPALLRGRRAVIAGDPRQLRQVSFLSDAEISDALDTQGIADPILRARLDVRRNSTLDAAVAVAEPIVLDEHFRSAPHLVDFVTRRLYNGRVKVATRKPTTQSCDCIDTVRCEGDRDGRNVVQAEVDAVLRLLRSERFASSSVGVVTPFRAQAEAIEAAALRAFSAEAIEAMDLRIGTVHGFQGNERDVVIVSLGVGETKAAWKFVEDPSLAAVLLTRARDKLVIVYAGDPPDRGLLDGYLAEADAPPGPPRAAREPSPWVATIHAEAQRAGISLLPSYPTGRHVVDLAVAEEWRDVAIEADIHPNGVESHIRRRLEMMHRGWTFIEAYRSKWLGKEAELAVELVNHLRH